MSNKENSFLKDNWFLLVAIVYLLLPTDFIPDIIPFLGKIDDTLIFIIELINRFRFYKGQELKRVDKETFAEKNQ